MMPSLFSGQNVSQPRLRFYTFSEESGPVSFSPGHFGSLRTAKLNPYASRLSTAAVQHVPVMSVPEVKDPLPAFQASHRGLLEVWRLTVTWPPFSVLLGNTFHQPAAKGRIFTCP